MPPPTPGFILGDTRDTGTWADTGDAGLFVSRRRKIINRPQQAHRAVDLDLTVVRKVDQHQLALIRPAAAAYNAGSVGQAYHALPDMKARLAVVGLDGRQEVRPELGLQCQGITLLGFSLFTQTAHTLDQRLHIRLMLLVGGRFLRLRFRTVRPRRRHFSRRGGFNRLPLSRALRLRRAVRGRPSRRHRGCCLIIRRCFGRLVRDLLKYTRCGLGFAGRLRGRGGCFRRVRKGGGAYGADWSGEVPSSCPLSCATARGASYTAGRRD